MTKSTKAGHTGPATPLPWRLTKQDDWDGPVVEIEGAPDEKGWRGTVACNTAYYPTAIDPEDAAYIVHAANCFPDLLEALQIALDEREQEHGRLPDGAPHWSVRARAAIAKALPTSGGSNG